LLRQKIEIRGISQRRLRGRGEVKKKKKINALNEGEEERKKRGCGVVIK